MLIKEMIKTDIIKLYGFRFSTGKRNDYFDVVNNGKETQFYHNNLFIFGISNKELNKRQ